MDKHRELIESFMRACNDADACLTALLVTEDFELRLLCGKTLIGREAARWFASQHGLGVSARLEGYDRLSAREVALVVRVTHADPATGAVEQERVVGSVARISEGRIARLRILESPVAAAR